MKKGYIAAVSAVFTMCLFFSANSGPAKGIADKATNPGKTIQIEKKAAPVKKLDTGAVNTEAQKIKEQLETNKQCQSHMNSCIQEQLDEKEKNTGKKALSVTVDVAAALNIYLKNIL